MTWAKLKCFFGWHEWVLDRSYVMGMWDEFYKKKCIHCHRTNKEFYKNYNQNKIGEMVI